MPDCADHVEPRVLEQARDPLAQEHRVLGEDDAHPVPQPAEGVAERREVPRQLVGEQLPDRLGLR